MKTSAAALTLLLLLMPLAGCIGEDAAPVEGASADGAAPPAADAGAPPGAAAPAAAPPATAEAPAQPAVLVPIDLEGNIAPNVMVCPLVICAGANPLASTRFFEQDARGGLVEYELTLTWEAATPASERLRLGLGKGEGQSREILYVEGTSPLVLSGDEFAVGEGKFDIWVWRTSLTPGAELYTGADQPFAITGTITLLEG